MIRKLLMVMLIVLYGWFLTQLNFYDLYFDSLIAGLETTSALITLAGLIISCVGIFFKKQWARRLFFLFNGIYLLLGFYIVHFGWTFFIFTEPTLAQRFENIRMPILIGVLLPLCLFQYFALENKVVSRKP